MSWNASTRSSPELSSRGRFVKALAGLAVLSAIGFAGGSLRAQMEEHPIDDITAKYHFLSTDDTLAILDEEGRLKGYIEVQQGDEESDDFLNYNIVDGTRKKLHVEFRTNKIHGKYYRFTGDVERGAGHKDGDPDYLRLIGDVEIVSVKTDPGKPDSPQEAVQRMRVLLKSFGKSEREDN
jgi:hypothetical protein